MLSINNVYKNYIRVILNLLVDIFSFYVSLIIAFKLRELLGIVFLSIFPTFDHKLSSYIFYLPFIITYISILSLLEINIKKRFFWEDVREYFKAILVYSLLIFASLSISRQIYDFSRTVIVLHIIFLIILNPVFKYLFTVFIINRILPIYVCYIGPKESLKKFFHSFLNDKYLGFKLVDVDQAEYIFISDKLDNYWDIFLNFQKKKRKAYILEEKKDFPPLIYKIHLKIGESVMALEYENKLLDGFNLLVKRVIDYVISIVLLPIIIPLMILIAILIKLDSKGPVFYFHERVGKNGKKFKCIKFRTMYTDAEEKLKEYLYNPDKKKEWETYRKLKDDPRITKIGRFLRKTSLDEIPQIINVLKGDMSLVGPRPVTEEELNKYYGEFKEYYISVYPGITGLWQVSGRNKLSYKERIFLDVWYVLNWSIWIDFIILVKTIREIFKPSGI